MACISRRTFRKTFSRFTLNDLLTWLIDIPNESHNIRHRIQREITQKTLCKNINTTALGLVLGDEGRLFVIGNQITVKSSKSVQVRINHAIIQIFHISTKAPKSLLSFGSQMVRLKHLIIGHSDKTQSEVLMEKMEVLSRTRTFDLQTLEFYGPGFGEEYVQYLNRAWYLFPEVRITRLTHMDPVAKCDLVSTGSKNQCDSFLTVRVAKSPLPSKPTCPRAFIFWGYHSGRLLYEVEGACHRFVCNSRKFEKFYFIK
ncbi:hypothetical protein EYR41_006093 [Orbilia oligospora]|uniref:Uncharacterized protein n=1 Tax=Orbilia oligospora TaxID=2813651 RepID=A0A8H2E447_ORBOL|nr:hypothetical protein EYR41_006093 [Orbilia oligospora]